MTDLKLREVDLDLDCWEYKCEGIGSIVLQFAASSANKNHPLNGKILRIRKNKKYENSLSQNSENSNLNVQNSNSNLANDKDHQSQFVHQYQKFVMEPLMNKSVDQNIPAKCSFFSSGDIIAVNEQFLREIGSKIDPARPKFRKDEGISIDYFAKEAIILPDYTRMDESQKDKEVLFFKEIIQSKIFLKKNLSKKKTHCDS